MSWSFLAHATPPQVTVTLAVNRILGIVALAGFMMSALVHVAALAGVAVFERVPTVWLLHVGIFAVFIPFVTSSRRELQSNTGLDQMLAIVPSWVALIGGALFAYAFINFLVFMSRTQGGNPSLENGKFVLLNHGHLIRELTPAEYTAYRANEARGFSGHWLVFYFVPFAYFMFGKKPNHLPQPTLAHG